MSGAAFPASRPRPGGRQLQAWRSRPARSTVDREFSDAPHGTVGVLVAVAVIKALIEVPLGASIVTAQDGFGGVSATTHAWGLVLGPSLFLAALFGAVGAYGAYHLRRFGVLLLAGSYLVDALLFVWLVTFIALGRLESHFGVGPYILFLCISAVATVELLGIARRSRLL